MSAGENGRLRVVYLDHCALRSGAELALARLLPALDDVDATVVLAEEGPLVALLEEGGIAVTVRPMAERSRNLRRAAVVPGIGALRAVAGTLAYSLALARELRHRRLDLVVTNSLKAAIYGGVAARLAGVPLIWHLHDRIAVDYLPSAAVRLIRVAARVLPKAVIANSETTLATLELPRGRHPATRVIGNVCPLADTPSPQEPRESHRPFTVGIVGRLAPWKGQDLFLRAFARAFGSSDARGLVIGGALFGESDFADELGHLAGELGIADRIRFTGHLDDPWPDMARLDILVHASVVPEPFGQVVVEGMALGVCVVASDTGGPAEIIDPGTDGLLFETGDEAALARALGRLAADDALRDRLRSAGPKGAARFAAGPIAAEEQEMYHSVVGGSA